jgi:hypothetical protein
LNKSPALTATVSIPLEVELGVPFTMTVTASNPHEVPATLDSVDIDEAFLAGFQVLSVEPRATNTSHIPLANQRSWDFGQSVPPGGSATVTFTLRAVAEGRFSGDVDVCNPTLDWNTQLVDVIVNPKRSSPPGPQAPPAQPASPRTAPRNRR